MSLPEKKVNDNFACNRFAMLRFITILYCILCNIEGNAQIGGVVIDMETRKPLRDVKVYMNTQKSTVTNWAGRFDTDGNFGSATFTHGNYVPRVMKREEMRDTIYLLPKMNELAEVIVYGKKPGPKFNYSGMTKTDAQLANYQGGGFNILGLAAMAVDALVKDKHKMTKQQKVKKILDNY